MRSKVWRNGFLFVWLGASIFAGAEIAGADPGAGGENPVLFRDLTYRRGFQLGFPSSAKGRAVEQILDAGDPAVSPVWRLCQWGTRRTLAGAPLVRLPNGDLSRENETKRVVIGGGGPERPDLVLEIRGGAEYEGRARRSGEAWPHLLVEQDAAEIVTLDRLARLDLEVTLRLAAFRDRMEGRADPSLHAAQFQLYFIVKETAPGAGAKGDYFWFGVPFFDSRRPIPPPHRGKDVGKDDATGKLIYAIDGREALSAPLADGTPVTVRKDLLPFIRRGLAAAVEDGFLTSADPGRYAVVNMNLGWEIPGAFDAAMEVRGLSITAVRRPVGEESKVPK